MLCLECGREVRNINFRHLQSCSRITPQKYQVKHPGAELVDLDVKKSYGLPMEKNPKWKGGRSYRNCEYCGKRLSRHTKSERCRSCTWIGKQNPFSGKEHTSETRARMIRSAKLRNPATYRPGKPSPEKMSLARRNYWSKIPKEERSTKLRSFIVAGQRHNKKASKTKIENTMSQVLLELGLIYKRNVQVGRYNVDFLVEEKTIIECFGDYWHCNTRLYTPDFYHRSLHITAEERWSRDALHRKQLESQGYIFVSFWEYDIKNDLERVKEEIVILFNSTNNI
jgi:very-short-patch-repair endonuclease